MKVNMDAMRRQMTHALNRLAGELLIHIPEKTTGSVYWTDSVTWRVIWALNCLYADDDELFNDIADDEVEVMVQRLKASGETPALP